MTSKNLIEIFNDDIEFNEQVFAKYTHIRRKFYGIEEFITAVSNDSFLNDDLTEVIFKDSNEHEIFIEDFMKLTKEFFSLLEECVCEKGFFDVYDNYTNNVFDLYCELVYEDD